MAASGPRRHRRRDAPLRLLHAYAAEVSTNAVPDPRPTSAPGPVVVRTWHDAERLAAAHMDRIGFHDAHVTPGGSDGGVDVRAAAGVAQVKRWANKVGAPHIRQLMGAAQLEKRRALFYTNNGYSAEAVATADRAGVALFNFTDAGSVAPANAVAAALTGEQLVVLAPPRTNPPRSSARIKVTQSEGKVTATVRGQRPGSTTFRGSLLDADLKQVTKTVEKARRQVAKRTQSALSGRRAKATQAERVVAAAERELRASAQLPANDKRRKDHHKAAARLAAEAVKHL